MRWPADGEAGQRVRRVRPVSLWRRPVLLARPVAQSVELPLP